MKKLTVTIGIPVHNEVNNISYLLESILKQKQTNYMLEKIIVVCDGTTDGTDKVVMEKAEENPGISLINDKKRKGKMARLMEIYKLNKSDTVIVFDGDVVLAHTEVIEEMIKEFKNNIQIVSGNNQPIPAETLTGKLINQWSHVWYIARRDFNNGDNIHNIRGCVMALNGKFAKTIKFPENVVSDAQYIYFYALSKKARFAFARNAIVYYRKPEIVNDYLLQTKRSDPEEKRLSVIFGKEIKRKYKIPKTVSVMALFKAFLESPVITTLAAGFHIYSQFLPYNKGSDNEVLWKAPQSTKKGIAIDSL